MFSLDCKYYDREFPTLDELLEDILLLGMDPNYEITRDGRPTGDRAIDLLPE